MHGLNDDRSIGDILSETYDMEDENLTGVFESENPFKVLSRGLSVDKDGGTQEIKVVRYKRNRGMRDSIDQEMFAALSPDLKLNVLFENITNVEQSQDSICQINAAVSSIARKVDSVGGQVSEHTDVLQS